MSAEEMHRILKDEYGIEEFEKAQKEFKGIDIGLFTEGRKNEKSD